MISVPFIVGAFALSLLTQFVKNIVFPKYGATGVHILMFILACLGVVCVGLYTSMPSVAKIIEEGLALLASAIAMYEVLLSKLGFSQGTTV